MKKVLFFLLFSFSAQAKLTDYQTELDYIAKITPLVLEVNQDVLKEREQITSIDLKNLSDADKKILDKKAEKYNEFTRFKDIKRYTYLHENLLDKIDAISPSLLIAISGIETDFGRSRIVKEANSLYKEIIWDNSGLKPAGETEDAGYTIKKFATLKDSITSYLLKINSSIDFRHLRYARKIQRIMHRPLQGRDVAQDLSLQTPLKNYTGLLDYTITFYELDELDRQNNYFK